MKRSGSYLKLALGLAMWRVAVSIANFFLGVM
jgi:hypothetical protein